MDCIIVANSTAFYRFRKLLFFSHGVPQYFVLWPLFGVYQLWMRGDDVCGAIGGMRIGRGNRSTQRKSSLVPLCLPQIPYDLIPDRTWPPQWEAGDGPYELWRGSYEDK
jgi:hypothetical protein